RALAMFRGRNEGVLQLSLNADPQFDEPPKESYCEQIIMDHLGLRLNNAPADSWRKGVVSWTWRIKVLMHLETELMGTVRERAEVGDVGHRTFEDHTRLQVVHCLDAIG
ncbi:hypothetical protein ACUOFC_49975, partial [Escherichia sp. TWPC-MK]